MSDDQDLRLWSGVSIRDPALSMVGRVYADERDRTFYVEKLYRGGPGMFTNTRLA
jgi:hypothetical protein